MKSKEKPIDIIKVRLDNIRATRGVHLSDVFYLTLALAEEVIILNSKIEKLNRSLAKTNHNVMTGGPRF